MKLYEFIQPFFGNLDRLTNELQGGQARHIRIGASTIVLRDYVPRFLRGLRKKFPALKASLREGFPAQFEKMLAQDEIDVAITLLDQKNPAGFQSLTLLELPMVLLVEKSKPLQNGGGIMEARQDQGIADLPAAIGIPFPRFFATTRQAGCGLVSGH